MKAPRRGLPSPPRLELSGSEPSYEPQSRSINSSQKATPTQGAAEEAAITTAAKSGVFAEGMWKEISADASDGAPAFSNEAKRIKALMEAVLKEGYERRVLFKSAPDEDTGLASSLHGFQMNLGALSLHEI